MIDQHELDTTARAIVDASLYMVLGTVDRDGRPWVSPVSYATASQHSILCPWPSGPCPVHGPAHDHRVAVNP